MTTTHCCDKHAAKHEAAELAWIREAGMDLIKVWSATSVLNERGTRAYVLVYPDGTGALHPCRETALANAEQVAELLQTSSAAELKDRLAGLMNEFGPHYFPLVQAANVAVDAYAATRKGTPDLAKLARDVS